MSNRIISDITDFIFMEDVPEKCDVILIPGTSKAAVTEKAAELYCAGYAPYIIPSGMYSSTLGHFAVENIDDFLYDGDYATDFEYCKHILMVNGVPESAILREDKATNSMENAMYSAQVAKDAGIKMESAIICCQAFHARRAFMSYASHFVDTELMVVPVVTQNITKDRWYQSEIGYKKVMSEVAKCGNYFKELRERFCS